MLMINVLLLCSSVECSKCYIDVRRLRTMQPIHYLLYSGGHVEGYIVIDVPISHDIYIYIYL